MKEELQAILMEEKADDQGIMNDGAPSLNALRVTYRPWYKDVGCTGHSWKKVFWRILNGILAVLFASATVLQWNDPDIHVWTIVYIVPCLLSLSVATWANIQDLIAWKLIALLHIIGCLAGVVFISIKYGEKISRAQPNITSVEEGWELCGLLVVSLWLIIASTVASYRSCKEKFMKSVTASKRHSNSMPERL